MTKQSQSTNNQAGTALLYHHISDAPCPYIKNLNITHSCDSFKKQIKYLSENFNLVSYSNFISSSERKGKVCITFDDGYKSIIKTVLPILERYSCPAKISISSEPIIEQLSWLNKLSLLLEQLENEKLQELASKALKMGRLPERINTLLFIDNFKETLTPKIIDHFFRILANKPSHEGLYLSGEDLKELSTHSLLEWGSHTTHHYPLNKLRNSLIRSEIFEAHKIIKTIFPNHCINFTTPFSKFHGKEKQIIRAIKSIDSSPLVISTNGLRLDTKLSGLELVPRSTAPQSILKLKLLLGQTQSFRLKVTETLKSQVKIIRYRDLESYAKTIPTLPEGSLIPTSRSRAKMMVKNPDAEPGDPALVVLEDKEMGILIYWGIMPSYLTIDGQKQKVFWSSTGMVRSDFRGRGASLACFSRIANEVGIFCSAGNSKGAEDMYRYLGLKNIPTHDSITLRVWLFNPRLLLLRLFSLNKCLKTSAVDSESKPAKSILYLGKFLRFLSIGPYLIRFNHEKFSSEAVSLLEANQKARFYRSGATIEWMINNPLSTNFPELSLKEKDYFFAFKDKKISFYRLEVLHKRTKKTVAVSVFSTIKGKVLNESKTKILDHACTTKLGRTLTLLIALVISLTSGAKFLLIPERLFSNSLLRYLPKFFWKINLQNYFIHSKDPSLSNSISKFNFSLADGDLGLY